MRVAICSSEIRTSRFGLLNSESNWADEVANLFLLFVQVLVEQEFACLPRCATYYASSSFRSMPNNISLRNLCVSAVAVLMLFAVSAFAQTTAVQPCQPTASPPRVRLLTVDESVPPDPDVEKIIAPYSEKVRELSKVIGRLEGGLSKTGVGAGTLGNFVSDGMRAEAQAKLGKPVVLAIMNAGGLRKNNIAAGDLRASDIFELLPFENALVALEVTGEQLVKILAVA